MSADESSPPWPAGLALTLPSSHARWREPTRPDRLTFAGADNSYIAAPNPSDRHDWLEALHAYRSAVRNAKLHRTRIAELTLENEPVWATLDAAIANALNFNSLDEAVLEITIRTPSNAAQTLAIRWENAGLAHIDPIPITASNEWQTHRISLRAPQHARNLMIGLDPEKGSSPGTIQIRNLALHTTDLPRTARISEMLHSRLDALRDYRIYDRKKSRWLATAFTCHFTFMYDTDFYHPDTGYHLDGMLDDGEREFGGYDAVLLWHAYPRLGLDQRSQIDFYRDMPGGLAKLRTLVARAHKRNVRVFINYNPWDTATRPEAAPPESFLADLVDTINADGIFLDTLANVPPSLPETIESARPGAVLCPEINPPLDMLPLAAASWAQWSFNPDESPGLDHRKWIEPRHMRWQIRRWDRTHLEEIRRAFLNGSGMMIWENIFGAYNPWTHEDRATWRRASKILHRFNNHFITTRWDPFVPIADDTNIIAHRWPTPNADLYTILHTGVAESDELLQAQLMIEDGPDTRFYDLWRPSPEPLGANRVNAAWRLTLPLDPYAKLTALLAAHATEPPQTLQDYLDQPTSHTRIRSSLPLRAGAVEVREAPVSVRTPSIYSPVSPGMTYVPDATFQFHVEHMRRECGCYPDPNATREKADNHVWGDPFQQTLIHDFPVTVAPFLIDETAVTNAQYADFLDATHYRPAHPHKFLAHWTNGRVPDHLPDHPVVYVDIDDARAYARWAGKRLPTEFEWHLAAQGLDGRKWPWGNEYRPECVNLTGATMPARSLDAGRSPYGCYHMAGNVYELTESLRSDGHTRYLILRGGSYFRAEGSIWYMDGGPQPCDHHAKCILMWPGLDRCATVGFRCVQAVT